ncbi:putative conserved region of Rad21 / Rec8 like protein [Lyophyllum shimeji]|uniref:Conserved region of Rad21 / Rec8 like protein n=1 Tax=Lyophyllum shimeji TaxID=47721 RepID=A0A9P3PKR1_LYOSH|nr:putative conserved region of Rad21 / Rec8 like protein [Lyophyllum shimeji]
MFYSETILSRRGPLGKVWLAAHMERKLSKTQTLQTDIEQSVEAIMGQEVEVMALRLSGQLLLGVVRIYSRKAKYLLDDCNEALLKIKMAFRPGIVDMTEDQLAVNKNAITLQPGGLDLDLLLPDVNWEADFEDRPIQPHGQHQAHIEDITLRTVNDFQDFDLDDPFGIGPSDGIGSQDFEVDLGLDDWDAPAAKEDEMSVDESVGVGRDAASHRDSIHSHLLGRNGVDLDMDIISNRSKTRELSEHPFDHDVNMDFPDPMGMDLGDLGIGFEDQPLDTREKTPGETRASSRASSPLTEPPVTPPPGEPLATELTQEAAKAKRKPKEKKQIIDSVTELADGPGAKVGRGPAGGLGAPMTKDVSDIITEQQFLPRSTVVMRLLAIRDDPLAHFLPTKVTPNGTFFCAAPPGLAPELAELFMRPVNGGAPKRRGVSPDKSPSKRQRLEEEEVEQARRAASLAPSQALGSDVMGRASLGPDGVIDFADQTGGPEDFQLEVPEFDTGLGDIDMERARSKSAPLSELSRLSTPGPDGIPIEEGDETYADAACPIAMFDMRPSQGQSQATEVEAPSADHEGKGYSKNTIKTVGLIRKELQPVAGQEDEDKVLSFQKMSDKASRRAAASFFFELLVLATRDCVKLSQPAPFENIEVRAKDKLWEQQRHGSVAPSRFGSVAPSRHSSVAPSRSESMSPTRGGIVAGSIGVAMGL